MGRHCSYRLFIPRENLRSALLLIAGAAEDIAEGRTTLEFPDHEVSLPFTLEFGKESRIPFDGALRDHYFALSLYFPMDPVVEEYVKEWREDIRAEFPGEWEPTLDASGRVAIGYIYLSVGEAAIVERSDGPPSALLPLNFDVAISRMNALFEESAAVRDIFIALAEKTGALYVLLDREVDALLVWRNGERRNDYIEDPELGLSEIERLIDVNMGNR